MCTNRHRRGRGSRSTCMIRRAVYGWSGSHRLLLGVRLVIFWVVVMRIWLTIVQVLLRVIVQRMICRITLVSIQWTRRSYWISVCTTIEAGIICWLGSPRWGRLMGLSYKPRLVALAFPRRRFLFKRPSLWHGLRQSNIRQHLRQFSWAV